MIDQHTMREELGDFNSIICFRALITGIEDALGPRAAMIALLSAGRARGRNLAKELGLSDASANYNEISDLMNSVLGVQGTRLCIIDKIESPEANVLLVYCRETVCSANEEPGSNRELSYTMGAVQGVLEEVTGKRLRGKQVSSVLRGGTHDVIQLTPLR
ncbi:MAG: hypothetical protein WA949_15620 [Phormidesmis sp.]